MYTRKCDGNPTVAFFISTFALLTSLTTKLPHLFTNGEYNERRNTHRRFGQMGPTHPQIFDRLRTFDTELFVHAGGAGLVLIGIGDHVEIQTTLRS